MKKIILFITVSLLYILFNNITVYGKINLNLKKNEIAIIFIQDNIMVLERVGSTTTNMEFKEGSMAVSLYNTPYGVLDLNVDTEKLNINIDENGGDIYSRYTLGLDGQEGITTELNIKIKVN